MLKSDDSERGKVEPHAAYDEEAQITWYVVDHYTHLMTRTEQSALSALRMMAKARATDDPRMAEMLSKRWRNPTDRIVREALEIGSEAFHRRLAKRLLVDQASKIDLNRCPRCDRVPRTPKARQCPWCFFRWHEQSMD